MFGEYSKSIINYSNFLMKHELGNDSKATTCFGVFLLLRRIMEFSAVSQSYTNNAKHGNDFFPFERLYEFYPHRMAIRLPMKGEETLYT